MHLFFSIARPVMLAFVLLTGLVGCSSAKNTPPLPSFATDPERLYLAGVSSGGYMVHQLHLAWPEEIQGVAIFSAGPYGCARGGLADALQRCMLIQRGAPQAQTSIELITAAMETEQLGHPSALAKDRVFLYHGLADRIVHPRVGEALQAVYRHWLDDTQLSVYLDPDAGHDLPAEGASLSLAHLDGQPRSSIIFNAGISLSANVQAFNQRPFFEQSRGLANEGYYYQPVDCIDQSCGLLIVLHGCNQAAEQVGLGFIEDSGYLEAAEAHQLVVIFPQARSRMANPKACWDWWGLESNDYDIRTGRQMQALRSLWRAAQTPM